MVTAVVGFLSSTFTVFGATISVWQAVLFTASMLGVFDPDMPDLSGMGSSSPTYSFGPLTNTKSQLIPVPVVYGECRVGGNILRQYYPSDDRKDVQMFVGVSEGPIESISDVLANDVDPLTLSGCSVDKYLGTSTQTADTRDPEGIAYRYTAYVALTLKAQDGLSGNPVISSIVKGRKVKVWDTDTSAWVTEYSSNPIWCIRDFLTNTRYGLGLAEAWIDDVTFKAAAAYCDILLDDEPRFSLNYVVDSQQSILDHLKDMLATCRGFLVTRDTIKVYIDQPVVSAYKAITMDNIVKGSFSWWQLADEDKANRVVVAWTDPDDSYEASNIFVQDDDDITTNGVREKTFQLQGITSAGQAARMAQYLLNQYVYGVNQCSFNLGVKDSDVEVNDVIALSHDLPGWDEKLFRVISVTDSENDTAQVICCEYNANVYSDTTPDYQRVEIDSTLGDPVVAPDVSNFSVSLIGDELQFTWTPVDQSWATVTGYEIRRGDLWASAQTVASITGRNASSTTAGTATVGTNVYWIAAFNAHGYSANPTNDSILITALPERSNIISFSDVDEAATVADYVSKEGGVLYQHHRLLYSDMSGYTYEDAANIYPYGASMGTGTATTEVMDVGKIATFIVTPVETWRYTPDRQSLWEYKISDDNVTFSDWTTLPLGYVSGRYVQLRVTIRGLSNVGILEDIDITMTAKKQRLEFIDQEITVAADGLAITFTPAFINSPAIVCSPDDANRTPSIPITSKSGSGCTVFLDEAGVKKTGKFDLIAEGF